jgi:hypothetical protein
MERHGLMSGSKCVGPSYTHRPQLCRRCCHTPAVATTTSASLRENLVNLGMVWLATLARSASASLSPGTYRQRFSRHSEECGTLEQRNVARLGCRWGDSAFPGLRKRADNFKLLTMEPYLHLTIQPCNLALIS